MQTGHTPTSTDDNKPETRTKRANRGVQSSSHRNTTRKKSDTGNSITFNLNVPEFDAVLGTKYKNYKESF